MPAPRLCLLLSSLVVVPAGLVLAVAGPAGAGPAGAGPAGAGPAGAVPVGAASVGSDFGAHVSACAQMSTGFSGDHNPSHHRGPSGGHARTEC